MFMKNRWNWITIFGLSLFFFFEKSSTPQSFYQRDTLFKENYNVKCICSLKNPLHLRMLDLYRIITIELPSHWSINTVQRYQRFLLFSSDSLHSKIARPTHECINNLFPSTDASSLENSSKLYINEIVEQPFPLLAIKISRRNIFRIRPPDRKFKVPSVTVECSRLARRWHDKAEMKERSAPFRWHSNVAFLTMQPHISRILSLSLPPPFVGKRFRVGNSTSTSSSNSSWSPSPRPSPAKQMTLETNERRRRRLSFVRAGTHGIRPCLRRRGGRRIKKYRRRIFVSVSQTILLNGSRKAFQEGDRFYRWCYRFSAVTSSDRCFQFLTGGFQGFFFFFFLEGGRIERKSFK